MELNRRHKYNFIALMEPSQRPQELEQYKKRLILQNAYSNCSDKILVFELMNGKRGCKRQYSTTYIENQQRNNRDVIDKHVCKI